MSDAEKDRYWLMEASYQGGSMYAGVVVDEAPVRLRSLERRGLVELREPHNPSHKARYIITEAGRALLQQKDRER